MLDYCEMEVETYRRQHLNETNKLLSFSMHANQNAFDRFLAHVESNATKYKSDSVLELKKLDFCSRGYQKNRSSQHLKREKAISQCTLIKMLPAGSPSSFRMPSSLHNKLK